LQRLRLTINVKYTYNLSYLTIHKRARKAKRGESLFSFRLTKKNIHSLNIEFQLSDQTTFGT